MHALALTQLFAQGTRFAAGRRRDPSQHFPT
jgi:hypothetical protein